MDKPPISVPAESRPTNELQECLERLQKQWPYCEKSTIELAIRLASLPVGESTLEPDVEPDTTIPHTSQELGEIFGKVFKPAKPEPELGLGESREPLPDRIMSVTTPDGLQVINDFQKLPSVPAEIESTKKSLGCTSVADTKDGSGALTHCDRDAD
jgi:hypothetical protein